MTRSRVMKFTGLASLWGCVFTCTVCLVGCSKSNRTEQNMNTIADRPESAFQKGRDRPPTAKTLYGMADILATQGKDTGCEYVLKRLIYEHPNFLPAYNSLAELQMRQGRINEAIDTISKGLSIHPNDPTLLNNLGMCWIARRDYEKALEMFAKAAGRTAENARYRANMAVTLGLMGRHEESLSLFRQILPEDKAGHNLKILRADGKKAND